MIRAETLKKIGLFDERIFMYHDELDLCLRVLDHGERLGVIDHALIWHKGSQHPGDRQEVHPVFRLRNLWYVLNKRRTARRVERSWLTSRLAYFRYMYYWYVREMDEGNAAAATAVLDGLADGLRKVGGPYQQRPRRLTQLVRPTFNSLRWFQALGQRANTARRTMTAPIRVGFVLHVMQVAGAEVLVNETIRRLGPRIDPVVFCLDAIGVLGERLLADGVPVVAYGRRPGLDLSVSRRMAADIRSRRVDILHAHQYTPFFYGAIAARLSSPRPRVIFTEHGRHYPTSSRRSGAGSIGRSSTDSRMT
jgi:hypothetical protein